MLLCLTDPTVSNFIVTSCHKKCEKYVSIFIFIRNMISTDSFLCDFFANPIKLIKNLGTEIDKIQKALLRWIINTNLAMPLLFTNSIHVQLQVKHPCYEDTMGFIID